MQVTLLSEVLFLCGTHFEGICTVGSKNAACSHYQFPARYVTLQKAAGSGNRPRLHLSNSIHRALFIIIVSALPTCSNTGDGIRSTMQGEFRRAFCGTILFSMLLCPDPHLLTQVTVLLAHHFQDYNSQDIHAAQVQVSLNNPVNVWTELYIRGYICITLAQLVYNVQHKWAWFTTMTNRRSSQRQFILIRSRMYIVH